MNINIGLLQGDAMVDDVKHVSDEPKHSLSALGDSDCFNLETYSPPFHVLDVLDTISPKNNKPQEFPLASLELLKTYQSKLVAPVSNPSCSNDSDRQKLSTNAIIKLAAERFIQSCSERVDISTLNHPFASSFFGIRGDDTRDVDLVGYLLSSAENIDQQRFDQAVRFLDQCWNLCSNKGTPVQRLVYYFSQALQEKINQKAGRITLNGKAMVSLDLEEALMSPRLANIAFHQKVPFSQVSQHTGVQAILENTSGAKKVHLIDLTILNGCSCVVLMQALAVRYGSPIEHLKVTAVGTKLKKNLEETGKQLMDFADSINLPFSFHVVAVEDMLDLDKSLFALDPDETIVMNSSYLFSTMITRPERLDRLLRVVRSMNPCITIVTETEGNLNSPVFVKRFVEDLFFHGALFDCLEDCMDRGDMYRMFLESVYFYEGIRNFVVMDKDERSIRHVNINVWKEFFSRFGMVQKDLSPSALYQARLLIKEVDCWSSCTLDMSEKYLTIGWKGTPIHSLSCWKFVED